MRAVGQFVESCGFVFVWTLWFRLRSHCVAKQGLCRSNPLDYFRTPNFSKARHVVVQIISPGPKT